MSVCACACSCVLTSVLVCQAWSLEPAAQPSWSPLAGPEPQGLRPEGLQVCHPHLPAVEFGSTGLQVVVGVSTTHVPGQASVLHPCRIRTLSVSRGWPLWPSVQGLVTSRPLCSGWPYRKQQTCLGTGGGARLRSPLTSGLRPNALPATLQCCDGGRPHLTQSAGGVGAASSTRGPCLPGGSISLVRKGTEASRAFSKA